MHRDHGWTSIQDLFVLRACGATQLTTAVSVHVLYRCNSTCSNHITALALISFNHWLQLCTYTEPWLFDICFISVTKRHVDSSSTSGEHRISLRRLRFFIRNNSKVAIKDYIYSQSPFNPFKRGGFRFFTLKKALGCLTKQRLHFLSSGNQYLLSVTFKRSTFSIPWNPVWKSIFLL